MISLAVGAAQFIVDLLSICHIKSPPALPIREGGQVLVGVVRHHQTLVVRHRGCRGGYSDVKAFAVRSLESDFVYVVGVQLRTDAGSGVVLSCESCSEVLAAQSHSRQRFVFVEKETRICV